MQAAVRIPVHDRVGLKALCRYIARPPLSGERLAELPEGLLSLRLKRPWFDGTTHLVLSPSELIERLIPLIPRPRSHIVRYHGVLAPAAGWRFQIVPAPHASDPKPLRQEGSPSVRDDRIPWAALLMRTFRTDVLACPRCAGRMTVLSAVLESRAAAAIRPAAILEHLGLDTEPPHVSSPRAPPTLIDGAAPAPNWDGIDPPAPKWE